MRELSVAECEAVAGGISTRAAILTAALSWLGFMLGAVLGSTLAAAPILTFGVLGAVAAGIGGYVVYNDD